MHAEPLVTRSHDTTAAPTQRLRVLLVEDSQRLAASIRDYLDILRSRRARRVSRSSSGSS